MMGSLVRRVTSWWPRSEAERFADRMYPDPPVVGDDSFEMDCAPAAGPAGVSPAGERIPPTMPPAGQPTWWCAECGKEMHTECAAAAPDGTSPYCSARCVDRYVIRTQGVDALPATDCCGGVIGHHWLCPIHAARRGTGITGTWRFTPEELAVMGLKTGDQLGTGIIGRPVSSGLTVFRAYNP